MTRMEVEARSDGRPDSGAIPAPRGRGEGSGLKVALVHDWLTNQGGAERVLWSLHKAFPDAPIYTSVFAPRALPQFAQAQVRTSFLQKWPLAATRHQLYPVLRTFAFESFDFSSYDVVISSCSAEAKGIVTRPETPHICYLHTPTRYYWSDHYRYAKNPGFGPLNPVIRLAMPAFIRHMRMWDLAATARVDAFIANSAFVAQRVEKYYRRNAVVIHPPIQLSRFSIAGDGPDDFFLIAGRLVPYKRVDLAVRACRDLDLPLVVAGTGSELPRLRAIAGPKTRFTGWVGDTEMAGYYRRARALIHCAEEDFGLIPLESMASGRPVIAFNGGGLQETVVEGLTGTFFDRQTVDSLKDALRRFQGMRFEPEILRDHAARFDEAIFIDKMKDFVTALSRGPAEVRTA
ncbi:glycosyltransferase [Actinoallomurus soli]|uniref:glycosyltransferase n=1 Tax=Actinoallomurus soli TaxID=2952535 RepID=UPI002092F529|nr:glycosyltransferase [Actinoallomurus soli]MCO5973023.1 glycosyltransferase [Actinoallomurus soli]